MRAVYDGRLAGTAADPARQALLVRLRPWVQALQCRVRESTQHDGIELILTVFGGKPCPPQSLGWVPAKPPGPACELDKVRARLANVPRDPEGYYRQVVGTICSIGESGGGQLGVLALIFAPGEEP